MSEELARREFTRTWDAADVTVRQDGTGRTVEALITPWDTPTEIRDQDGHYHETIGRTAFAKTLAERGLNFQVLFNHGRTYDGRTDGSLMVPIGVPRVVTDQHDRGLFSSTEFLDNPLADSILDAVKKGAIRGYSFSGKFIKSQRSRSAAGLPTINRSEIAMHEFGPVLFPAYATADILGTRAQSFIDELKTLDPEDLDAFRELLGVATPLEPATPDGTSPEAAVPPADPPSQSAGLRSTPEGRRLYVKAALLRKGFR